MPDPSDTPRGTRRAARVWATLREEIGPIVGLSCVVVPLGVIGLACLIGLPLLMWGLGTLARATLRGAKRRREEHLPEDGPVWRVGLYATFGLFALVVAALFAASVGVHLVGPGAPGFLRFGAGVAGVLLGSAAVGTALAPLSFAPFLAAEGEPGLRRPLSRSFELAARMPPRQVAAVGALAGLAVGGALLLVGFLFATTSPDVDAPVIAMLAAPFGIIPGPPIAAALLADAYVEAKAGVAARTDVDVHAGRRLRGVLALVAPVGLALFAALIVAALTPTPMQRLSHWERGATDRYQILATPAELRVPGQPLTVRSALRGVVVEADDGGGAGAIDADADTSQAALTLRPGEDHGGPPGSWAVIVVTDTETLFTLIDADGVRLDDGLGARVFGRLSGLGTVALVLGLLTALAMLFLIGAELGAARGLAAPSLLDADSPRLSGLAALDGTLRLAEGARARYRPASAWHRATGAGSSTLDVEGDGWVEAEAGALRFRLPAEPIAVLGVHGADDWDGQTVMLLSRFARTSPAGLREAWTPWPEDARLVLGNLDDARRALVDHTARLAGGLAVPTLGFWTVALVALVVAI